MFDFEHHTKPLLPIRQFRKRLLKNAFIGIVVLLIFLAIGISGYMFLADLKFIDALLNASMILGGMGPVDQLKSDNAKYFASAYAILSGVLLLSVIAVLFAPVLHRIMHKFHIESEAEEEKEDSGDRKSGRTKK